MWDLVQEACGGQAGRRPDAAAVRCPYGIEPGRQACPRRCPWTGPSILEAQLPEYPEFEATFGYLRSGYDAGRPW